MTNFIVDHAINFDIQSTYNSALEKMQVHRVHSYSSSFLAHTSPSSTMKLKLLEGRIGIL